MDHPKISTDGAGALQLNFGQYGNEVEVASISLDGARVLLVQDVGIACVYEIASETLLATLRPTSPLTGTHSGPTSSPFTVFIESAELTPDGRVAALGLNDGSCHLYSVDSGSLIVRLKEPIGLLPRKEMKRRVAEEPEERWELVRCLTISPDGTLLALGHFRAAVSVWNLATKEVVSYLRPSEQSASTGSSMPRSGFVTSVGFSSDSRYLFSGTSDGLANVWDLRENETVFAATRHTAKTLAISIDDRKITWINSNGEIRRSATDDQSKVIAEFKASWYSAAISSDATFGMTFGPNGCVYRINFARNELKTLAKVPELRSDRLTPFAFGRSDEECVYVNSNDTIALSHTNREVHLSSKFTRFVHSPDRTLFATITWSSSTNVYRSSDGELVGCFSSDTTPGSVAFSPDNKRLLIGELGNGGGLYDRHAFLFDIQSGIQLKKFVADQFQILGVGFGTDSNNFVTKSNSLSAWSYIDGEVRLVNRHEIDNHSNRLHVTHDGRMVVFLSQRVIVFDEQGTVIISFEFAIGFDEVIRFDEPNDLMVCARWNQRLEVWDFMRGVRIQQFESDFPTPEQVPSPRIRKGHDFLAGASIWKTDYGNFLHQGDGPRGWITPLQTSRCGDFLILPTETNGIVVQISRDRVIGECPFRGKLRASRCSASHAIMINQKGECFTATFS